MNLYEISNRYQQLLDLTEYNAEEAAELEAMHENMEAACIDRAKYIKNLEAEAEAIDKEIQIMAVRLRELESKAATQRDRLLGYMEQGNLSSIKSPNMVITIPKPRASVEIYDESAIPECYWRVTIPEPKKSVNKEALKEVLETSEVAGARLAYKTKVVFK